MTEIEDTGKRSTHDKTVLKGESWEIDRDDPLFPRPFLDLKRIPSRLYGVGSIDALAEGLAVVGARRATPYGLRAAQRFAGIAAEKGIAIVSGGARGCDAAAHRAALEHSAPTVAFLGGGCNRLYPAENKGLFQRIVDAGGAVVSEYPWDADPRPYGFRMRNRLIASLARATLIVEAGLPSGTFSTADEALAFGRDVLVVPGSISSPSSHGANRLIFQGAVPVIDDETFEVVISSLFGTVELRWESEKHEPACMQDWLIRALVAEPMHPEDITALVREQQGGNPSWGSIMARLIEAESASVVARYPDGKWGPLS